MGCGRQISLPKNEIAIPISPQIYFGNTCINCFAALIPSLVSVIKPILGATLITCNAVIIPSAEIFALRIVTCVDFLPIPFKAAKFSIVIGIFSSFWIVFFISKSHFALVLKFPILEIYGNNTYALEMVKRSIFGYALNGVVAILLI